MPSPKRHGFYVKLSAKTLREIKNLARHWGVSQWVVVAECVAQVKRAEDIRRAAKRTPEPPTHPSIATLNTPV